MKFLRTKIALLKSRHEKYENCRNMKISLFKIFSRKVQEVEGASKLSINSCDGNQKETLETESTSAIFCATQKGIA